MNEDTVSQTLVFCLEMHCFGEKHSIFFSKVRAEGSSSPLVRNKDSESVALDFFSPFFVEEGKHPISLYAFDKIHSSGIHDRTKRPIASRDRKAPGRQTGEGAFPSLMGCAVMLRSALLQYVHLFPPCNEGQDKSGADFHRIPKWERAPEAENINIYQET